MTASAIKILDVVGMTPTELAKAMGGSVVTFQSQCDRVYPVKTAKPKGRYAKRMAFYTLNRRKAQGSSVLNQLRADLPALTEQGAMVDAMSTVRDEWEGPNFNVFRAGTRIR